MTRPWSLSGCDVQRPPWGSLEALSALGPARWGLSCWEVMLGLDHEEPGTEVGVTAHTENSCLDFRARARDWGSGDPGPTLSPMHRGTICGKPPSLPGLSLLIHKMELITHYLPCKMVRKIKCACGQLVGRPVAGHSLVA